MMDACMKMALNGPNSATFRCYESMNQTDLSLKDSYPSFPTLQARLSTSLRPKIVSQDLMVLRGIVQPARGQVPKVGQAHQIFLDFAMQTSLLLIQLNIY